jgi:hypothetical protein
MSSFKRFPTSIRYLIARLRHWVQPTVWAPLAVLCAGGVFIWEVSVHPERLSIDDEEISASNHPPDPTAIAELSPEDSAIAAEIDSLPVLVNQFNRSNSDFALLNSSVVKDKGLFDEIRDRDREIPQPSLAPKRVASNSFLPLTSLANPNVSTAKNNPPNSSWQNSNATAALSLPGDGSSVSGIQTISPESGDTAPANLSTMPDGGTLGQKNENPLLLSPLQAAMKKYIATNPSATVTSTQQSGNEAKLLDRLTGGQPMTNQANIIPTSTAQNSANPVNFSGGLAPIPAPTNTIINDSQQFLNPAATAPESVAGLNLKVPSMPAITIQPATPALPKNPYQTNLSGSGLTPESQPAALPIATPSPIPVVPTNIGQSSFPSAIGGSKIINPEFSPNSANSQFQSVQPSQPYLPNQPNFGVVPQNTNLGIQPIQPQTFSAPRQIPGRYIGGGEINTFANP